MQVFTSFRILHENDVTQFSAHRHVVNSRSRWPSLELHARVNSQIQEKFHGTSDILDNGKNYLVSSSSSRRDQNNTITRSSNHTTLSIKHLKYKVYLLIANP